MPIDPNIPLQALVLGGAPQTTPLSGRMNIMNLRQLTGQVNEENRIRQEQGAVRQAIQKNATPTGVNAPALLGEVAQTAPGQFFAVQEATNKPMTAWLEGNTKLQDYALEQLGRIRDEASRNEIVGRLQANPQTAGYVPPAFANTPYDPAVYEGPKGLKRHLLSFKEELAQQGREADDERARKFGASAEADRKLAAERLEHERQVKRGQDNRDYETRIDKDFVERNVGFDKLTSTFGNMRQIEAMFDKDGNPTKAAKAAGIVDNQATYLIAKVLDPTGAVLTTDYANQVGGRSLIEMASAMAQRQQAGGTIRPEERQQLFKAIRDFYAAQREIVKEQAYELKTKAWQQGANPDNVGNQFGGIGRGWEPPTKTEGSQPRSAAPGATQPAAGKSGYPGFTVDQVEAAKADLTEAGIPLRPENIKLRLDEAYRK